MRVFTNSLLDCALAAVTASFGAGAIAVVKSPQLTDPKAALQPATSLIYEARLRDGPARSREEVMHGGECKEQCPSCLGAMTTDTTVEHGARNFMFWPRALGTPHD